MLVLKVHVAYLHILTLFHDEIIFFLSNFSIFFFLKIGTWANSCCQSFFLFFLLYLPQSPCTQLYILVAGPPSCGLLWDAASTWADERCHVCAQDANPGPPAAERKNLTTQPRSRPLYIFNVMFLMIWLNIDLY